MDNSNGSSQQETNEIAKQTIVAGCKIIQDILSSVIGPNGALKMLTSSHKESLITNDGATILKNLLIDSPSAQILIDTSIAQDREEGDGTTTVALLASLLVQKASSLDLHPIRILRGFDLATKHIFKELENMKFEADPHFLARTTLSSKILRSNIDLFASICVEATRCSQDIASINILKLPGSLEQSFFVADGFILENDAQLPEIKNPRILIANTAMDHDKVKIYGSKIEVSSISELSQLEEAEKLRMIAKVDGICSNISGLYNRPSTTQKNEESNIAATGNRYLNPKSQNSDHDNSKTPQNANNSGSKDSTAINHGKKTTFIDLFINRQIMYDLPKERFKENGVYCIDLANFDGIDRLHKVLGGSVVSSFYQPLHPKDLASCSRLFSTELFGKKVVFFEGIKNGAGTIVLCGSSESILNEAERSVHDALCVLRNKTTLPGGGATESFLANSLYDYAKTIDSAESSAIIAFAECLNEIVKIMANNCGFDGEEIKARLRSLNSQNSGKYYGIDIKSHDVSDMREKGIVESFNVKKRALTSAAEAAQILIKCDGYIRCKPRERTKM